MGAANPRKNDRKNGRGFLLPRSREEFRRRIVFLGRPPPATKAEPFTYPGRERRVHCDKPKLPIRGQSWQTTGRGYGRKRDREQKGAEENKQNSNVDYGPGNAGRLKKHVHDKRYPGLWFLGSMG